MSCDHMGAQGLDKRGRQRADLANPMLHALAGVDFGLVMPSQMIRQGLSHRLAFLGLRLEGRRWKALPGGGLDVLLRQFKLLDRAIDFFGTGAKPRPPQQRHCAFSFSISASRVWSRLFASAGSVAFAATIARKDSTSSGRSTTVWFMAGI
jgi:hypothetical protein